MFLIICLAGFACAIVAMVLLILFYIKGKPLVIPGILFYVFIAVFGVSLLLDFKFDGDTAEDVPGQTSALPSPDASVDVIMDLEQFSMVTLEELRTILGNEGEKDPDGVILTDTLNENSVHLDIYRFNNDQLEFIIWEDKVVRGTYNAPSYWGNEPIHFEKKEDIPLMFGISVSHSAYTRADTPMSYRIGTVNNKVDNFWVTLMDSENNTFDQVKATYYKYLE